MEKMFARLSLQNETRSILYTSYQDNFLDDISPFSPVKNILLFLLLIHEIYLSFLIYFPYHLP